MIFYAIFDRLNIFVVLVFMHYIGQFMMFENCLRILDLDVRIYHRIMLVFCLC